MYVSLLLHLLSFFLSDYYSLITFFIFKSFLASPSFKCLLCFFLGDFFLWYGIFSEVSTPGPLQHIDWPLLSPVPPPFLPLRDVHYYSTLTEVVYLSYHMSVCVKANCHSYYVERSTEAQSCWVNTFNRPYIFWQFRVKIQSKAVDFLFHIQKVSQIF